MYKMQVQPVMEENWNLKISRENKIKINKSLGILSVLIETDNLSEAKVLLKDILTQLSEHKN